MEKFLIISSILYIFYLIYEKKVHNLKLKKFKYIIHVNGIRGKSTVSRMIDGGLRNSNYRVFTKTTGTSPRIINTDNREIEIMRFGKANIKEQIEIVDIAYKEKADVLILECMAVDPSLQKICEEEILQSNIGVITNVRMDHLDQMGNSLESIAQSLSNTIPKNGALFIGESKFYNFFHDMGKSRETKVYLCEKFQESIEKIDNIFFEENYKIAYEVCKYLGIEKNKIIESFDKYKRDPGSLKVYYYINNNNKRIYFVNAMAANDPDSTQIILEKILLKYNEISKKFLLINNRIDRISRMEQFIKFVLKNQEKFDEIFISGSIKSLFKKKLLKEKINENKIKILPSIKYFDDLDTDILILAVGNICGYGKTLEEEISKKGEITYAI
ncbi:poly-gamma-glutamate synthase PgsB [Fusobacterium sp. PH5-44]|uniref:poly-gamma-glutamate synthase PgsB n=1 Tax=unclassified Fusobacterium TaxID=2648384 RepID=UPI003D1B2EF9